MHIREIELLLTLSLINLAVLLAEVSLHRLLLTPLAIFLRSHVYRRIEIGVAHLRTDDVKVERVVIFHLLLQVIGAFQVGRILVEVLHGDGQRALDFPSGVEQRVGN